MKPTTIDQVERFVAMSLDRAGQAPAVPQTKSSELYEFEQGVKVGMQQALQLVALYLTHGNDGLRVIDDGEFLCDNCGTAYDPIASRWLCGACGWKANCCEGQPAQPASGA